MRNISEAVDLWGDEILKRINQEEYEVLKEPHLDFVPEVYREFAVEFEEGMKY